MRNRPGERTTCSPSPRRARPWIDAQRARSSAASTSWFPS